MRSFGASLMQRAGIAGKGRLFRAAVHAEMVFVDPFFEPFVEFQKGEPVGYDGEELHSYGLEEPLDFSPALPADKGVEWTRAMPKEAVAWRNTWVEKAGPLST